MPDHHPNSAPQPADNSPPIPAAQPARWPTTDRPLRIAILGWARLSAQAWEGSGYNLSASELARGLALSGHDVSYLAAGMAYRLPRRPKIAHRETWGGVKCYDLWNSPNLSPSAANFRNTSSEIACPAETGLVLDWLDQLGVRIVHIHSLEGYGLDLIAAIRRSRDGKAGRPVVVTPHNYWYVCPQVDLLHQEARVCMDYDGGRRCVGCLPGEDVDRLTRRRAIRRAIEVRLGHPGADVLRRFAKEVIPKLARAVRGGLRKQDSPPVNPDRVIDPELPLGFENISPEDAGGGLIHHDLPLETSELPRPLEPSPLDQNERFLACTHHLRVLNQYGKRRVAGVEALNCASLVTPPSGFLLRAHVAMGVTESKMRWVRLGQPHFDQINRKARRSPFYDKRPWDPRTATRPLRFGFYGTIRNNKGLEVLLQAIPLLETEVRQRSQFVIRAMGWDWPLRKRMSAYPEVSFSGGYDLIQLIAASGDYDVGVLPHIWFENSPLVMLEHLHAGKFVIASRLGGPPDFITPEKNGLLFAAGRPDELAACITRIVTGGVVLPSPREVHRASILQSYPAHVMEVQGIYEELLEHAGDFPSPSQPGAPSLLSTQHSVIT